MATLVTPPSWTSTEEVEAITELITLRCAGGGAEHFERDEPGLEQVDMAYLPAPSQDLNASVDLDESRIFDLRDLVSSAIDIHRGTQVRSRDLIQFVILAKPRNGGTEDHDMESSNESRSDCNNDDPNNPGRDAVALGALVQDGNNNNRTSWTIPDAQTFHDLISRLDCHMVANGSACIRVQRLSLIHI